MKKQLFKSLFVLLVLCQSQNGFAAIFKCVSAQGKTYYNDKVCPKSDKETQLKNVKDPKGGYIPPPLKAKNIDNENGNVSNKVIVGEKSDRSLGSNNRKLSNTSSEEESSSSTSSERNQSNSSVAGDYQANGTVATNNSENAASSLSIVPLKVEEVTLEPRDEVK